MSGRINIPKLFFRSGVGSIILNVTNDCQLNISNSHNPRIWISLIDRFSSPITLKLLWWKLFRTRLRCPSRKNHKNTFMQIILSKHQSLSLASLSVGLSLMGRNEMYAPNYLNILWIWRPRKARRNPIDHRNSLPISPKWEKVLLFMTHWTSKPVIKS